MGGASADTSAIPRLADQLRAAGVELAELDPTYREVGRVVIAAARPPRLTGTLDAGLTATTGPNGVTFASSARYWTWVHFGAPRRNIRARLFFVEALEASTDELVDVYAQHAQHALDRIG